MKIDLTSLLYNLSSSFIAKAIWNNANNGMFQKFSHISK